MEDDKDGVKPTYSRHGINWWLGTIGEKNQGTINKWSGYLLAQIKSYQLYKEYFLKLNVKQQRIW